MSDLLIAGLAVGALIAVRVIYEGRRISQEDRLLELRPLKSQAVDCAGDAFNYEAFQRGWDDYCAREDRGEAPGVVEDWELQDALIEDREVEMLELWFARPSRPGRVR